MLYCSEIRSGGKGSAMPRRRTGSLVGAIYVLIGATLLAMALVAPWYCFDTVFEQHGGSPSNGILTSVGPSEINLYLVPLPGSEFVQTTCPSGNVSNFCPASSSYSDAGLTSVGWVVALTFALVAAGFAAAAISGLHGVLWRRRARTAFPEPILAFVAVGLVVAATSAFAALLPGAFAHDLSVPQRGGEQTGPWSSFYGSGSVVLNIPCPSIGCGSFAPSWGPAIGWCFAVAAIAVLLVGAVMMVRFGHNVARAVSPTES